MEEGRSIHPGPHCLLGLLEKPGPKALVSPGSICPRWSSARHSTGVTRNVTRTQVSWAEIALVVHAGEGQRVQLRHAPTDSGQRLHRRSDRGAVRHSSDSRIAGLSSGPQWWVSRICRNVIVASTFILLLAFFGLRMTTKPGSLVAAFFSIATTAVARFDAGLRYAVNPFAFEWLFAG